MKKNAEAPNASPPHTKKQRLILPNGRHGKHCANDDLADQQRPPFRTPKAGFERETKSFRVLV